MSKRLRLLSATMLMLALVTNVVWLQPAFADDLDPATLPPVVKKIYDRYDAPVNSGAVKRSFTWGAYFDQKTEAYAESPEGKRQVYYFDKGRLEITNPNGDQNNAFYVSSGLLLKEMITGEVQTGDNAGEKREPAEVPLSGDNPPVLPNVPTYASLVRLVSFDGSIQAGDQTGKGVGFLLSKGGKVEFNANLRDSFGVKNVAYDSVTGHNVADKFMDFMNSKGLYFDGTKNVTGQIYDPLYVFGRPISEAYWTNTTVAGKEQPVLIQAFERRLLSYTPGNPTEFQVELGNLGRAYAQWRYSTPGAPVTLDVPNPTFSEDGNKVYNDSASAMNTLKFLKLVGQIDGATKFTEFYAAPDRLQQIVENFNFGGGLVGRLNTIVIGKRVYQRGELPDGRVSPWVYEDEPTAFQWPTYTGVSLNNSAKLWNLGENTKIGSEDATRLASKGYDLSGLTSENSLFVSKATKYFVTEQIKQDFQGKQSNLNDIYTDYNKPVKIEAPANAQPANVGDIKDLAHTDDTASVRLSGAYQAYQLANKRAAQYVPGELVVKFKADVNASALSSFSASYNGLQASSRVTSNTNVFKVADVSTWQSTLAALKADPRVEYAEPNYLYYSQVVEPGDGGYSDQYYQKVIKSPLGWEINTGSKGISVAVLDSGIEATHDDLKDSFTDGFDYVDGKGAKSDPDGHGTLSAGVVTATGNNGIGGSGVVWGSQLYNFRVLNENGAGSNAAIAKAIRDAADKGVRVINMSLGGPSKSQTLEDAVNYAYGKGVVIIASAGNNGREGDPDRNKPEYPAAYAHVISVGALGRLNTPADFSNVGPTTTITAPGVAICNTIRTNKFGCSSGTSFSGPAVAGAATLLLSINPNLTPDQVKAVLITTATPAPGKQQGEFDPAYGYGTLNVFAAARLVALGQTPNVPDGVRP